MGLFIELQCLQSIAGITNSGLAPVIEVWQAQCPRHKNGWW